MERPGKGDDSRAFGPPWIKDVHGRDTSDSAYYTSANRGKKSITINIAVHTPPRHPAPRTSAQARHPFRHRQPAANKPNTQPGLTRRQLVTAILLSQPGRDWHGFELATKLHIKQHNLRTQLAEWARLGFIRRTGTGIGVIWLYRLTTTPIWFPPLSTGHRDLTTGRLTTHSDGPAYGGVPQDMHPAGG